MSTTIYTADDRMVAVRFFGGTATGPVVQLEITEAEMSAWADVPVTEEGYGDPVPLAEWLAAQKAEIRFDSAARRNASARVLEDHRWAAQDDSDVSLRLRAAAAAERQRARDCMRQTLRAA